MGEKYISALETCANIAEELNISEIIQSVQDTKNIAENNKNIVFVNFNPSPKGLVQIAEYICPLPEKLKDILNRGECAIFNIRYGENETYRLLNEDSSDKEPHTSNYLFESSTEILRNMTISFVHVSNDSLLNTRRLLKLSGASKIYLLLNASMVMTRTEAEWIENFINVRYDINRFAICVMGREYIVTPADWENVVSYVKDFTTPYGDVNLLFDKESIIKSITDDATNIEMLANAGVSNMVKNLLDDITADLTHLKELNIIREYDVIHVTDDLKKRRNMLSVKARLSVDNVIDNEFSLIYEMLSKRADDLEENTLKKFENNIKNAASLDNIETEIEIAMRDEWNNYVKESAIKIKKCFENITETLKERMRQDFDETLSELDEKSRKTLNTLFPRELYYMPNISYSAMEKSPNTKLNKKAVVIMMSAAPFAFFSPGLSVAALGSGLAYQYFTEKTEKAEYREELIKHTAQVFYNAKRQVLDEVLKMLKQEKPKVQEIVTNSYEEAALKLSEAIVKESENVSMQKDLSERINKYIETIQNISKNLKEA